MNVFNKFFKRKNIQLQNNMLSNLKSLNKHTYSSQEELENAATFLPIELISKDIFHGRKNLDIIKKYRASIKQSDLAIILGSNVDYGQNNCRITDGNFSPISASIWSSTIVREGNAILKQNGTCATADQGSRFISSCPASLFSSISSIVPQSVRGNDKILRFSDGTYPKTVVDVEKAKELSDEYELYETQQNTSLKPTGRGYTFDTFKPSDSTNDFLPRRYKEYELNGERFIQVFADPCFKQSTLSNGQKIWRGNLVWVKVEPRFLMLEEKPIDGKFVALPEVAQFSGVQFDMINNEYELSSIKIFNELRYAVECTESQQCPKEYILSDNYTRICSNAFYGLKGLERVVVPSSCKFFGKNAFFNPEIRSIGLKTINKVVDFYVPENYVVTNVDSGNDGLFILVNCTENKKKAQVYYVKESGEIISIKNLNVDYIDNLFNHKKIGLLFDWNTAKNNFFSNNVKDQLFFPKEYIMDAIDNTPEMIQKYYSTKSTGIMLLEKNEWFKNMYFDAQVVMVKLFISLGGFEPNTGHQKQVIDFLNKFEENISSEYDFSNKIMEIFGNLPLGLQHIQEKKIEYARNPNNEIVMENGFPKVLSEKTVSYHKQILKFFENNYKCFDFLDIASTLVKHYPKILKFYKNQLEKFNPERHNECDGVKYKELKGNGLNSEIVLEYMEDEKYLYENPELKPIISNLDKSIFINQFTIDGFDRYLTDAKIEEAKLKTKEILHGKVPKMKVFEPNVKDVSGDEITYLWPPITSAVALTIGLQFDTCFSVNDLNEAALETVLTSPTDALMLIFDGNEPYAYCRINYDRKNKGILIDIIELDKTKDYTDEEKRRIWQTCVRGIKDQKDAMNRANENIVERIQCKPDPYNRVFELIENEYPRISKVKAPKMEERHYQSAKNISNNSYYSSYSSDLEQIVIEGPELNKKKDLGGKQI